MEGRVSSSPSHVWQEAFSYHMGSCCGFCGFSKRTERLHYLGFLFYFFWKPTLSPHGLAFYKISL